MLIIIVLHSGEPVTEDNSSVNELTAETLRHILSHLPFELIFSDDQDIIRFYTETANPVFKRNQEILGLPVVDCHATRKTFIQQLLADFRDGRRSVFLTTSVVNSRSVLERYIAIRSEIGKYIGTLEIIQDIGSAEE